MRSGGWNQGAGLVLDVLREYLEGRAEVICVDASLSGDCRSYGVGMALLNGFGFEKIEYSSRGYHRNERVNTAYAELHAIRNAFPIAKKCGSDVYIFSDSTSAVKVMNGFLPRNEGLKKFHDEYSLLLKKFPHVSVNYLNKKLRMQRAKRKEDPPPAGYENVVGVLKIADRAAGMMMSEARSTERHNRMKGFYVGKKDCNGRYNYYPEKSIWYLRQPDVS